MIRSPIFVALLALAACTYGPVEERSRTVQVVRLGDSYEALAVVQHDTFRQPTGLSAFPDGGSARVLRRRALVYRVDARTRKIEVAHVLQAPDSLWESFGAWVAGLEGDSVAYLRLTGCPRGGECHPEIGRTAFLRLSSDGRVAPTDRVPVGSGLPGVMAARTPGEEHYVRFGIRGETITARFDESGRGPEHALFRVHSDGTAHFVGG